MRGLRRFARPGAWLVLAAAIGIGPTAAADGRPASLLSKGPYLTELSEAGVEVRFELAASAPASVEVRREGGPDAGAGSAGVVSTVADPGDTAWHVVVLGGLAPATRYGYSVRARGKIAGQGHFTTAPAPGSGVPVHFIVYGDDRSDVTAHAAVVQAMASSPCDLLVNTGDLVADGGRLEDWQTFFDIEAPLLRDHALFAAIGNHEIYDDRSGANFARYLGFRRPGGTADPYGSARIGSVRFFFLNAMHDWSSGEERAWLERELARADGEAGLVWRVAVMHHGPWSSGPHGPNTALVSAHIPELLAAHHVDLVISGHDHVYERGDGGGMKYVVSGGGGAPLYRAGHTAATRKSEAAYHFIEFTAAADAMHLTARRVDGSVLDQCGFGRGTGWDCDPPPPVPSVHAEGADSPKGDPHATPSPPARASSLFRCACASPGAPVGGPLALASVGLAFAAFRRRSRDTRSGNVRRSAPH